MFGVFNMIIQGEEFRVDFSYGPGQKAVCTATRPMVPSYYFRVEVIRVSSKGHKATADIKAFPR